VSRSPQIIEPKIGGKDCLGKGHKKGKTYTHEVDGDKRGKQKNGAFGAVPPFKKLKRGV